MASFQQIKSESEETQFELEREGDTDKWVKSVKESASLINSQENKKEESSGFLKQTKNQMKQLAKEAKVAVKNAVGKKKDNTDDATKDPMVANPSNDPSFEEYRA